MTEVHESERMHAISRETWDTVDQVLDYARRRALFENVPLDKPMRPTDLARLASGSITAEGIGARRAIGLFENVLAPACITTDHPGYLSFIPSAPTKAALAFDVVVSASAIYAGSWLEGSGAVFAENEVLHWLAAEFGLPAGAGGVFVQGGTIGNLSALVAARDVARRRNRAAGVADPPRWIIVCSAEAHSSIASAAAVMDVDVVTAAPDAGGRLHGDAVTGALDTHGAAVFAVVATGGTTNFGIVDDIASIAAATRGRDVWLHIDGAYGLAAMLVDRMRPAFAGVGEADSVIVDPHKWLFAPFDACALIYRDPSVALAAHTQKAEYLDTLTESADWNPSDLAIQLTRRARGLPLWFSLATHGTEHYRAGHRQRHPPRPAHRRRDHGARRPVARPRSPAVGGRLPPRGLARGRTIRPGPTACSKSRRRSSCRVRTRARPCCASRSSVRSRRSRPSRTSSTPSAELAGAAARSVMTSGPTRRQDPVASGRESTVAPLHGRHIDSTALATSSVTDSRRSFSCTQDLNPPRSVMNRRFRALVTGVVAVVAVPALVFGASPAWSADPISPPTLPDAVDARATRHRLRAACPTA